jgi:hypothetical protein
MPALLLLEVVLLCFELRLMLPSCVCVSFVNLELSARVFIILLSGFFHSVWFPGGLGYRDSTCAHNTNGMIALRRSSGSCLIENRAKHTKGNDNQKFYGNTLTASPSVSFVLLQGPQ